MIEMTYFKKIIRKLNKYYKDKMKIKNKILEIRN